MIVPKLNINKFLARGDRIKVLQGPNKDFVGNIIGRDGQILIVRNKTEQITVSTKHVRKWITKGRYYGTTNTVFLPVRDSAVLRLPHSGR